LLQFLSNSERPDAKERDESDSFHETRRKEEERVRRNRLNVRKGSLRGAIPAKEARRCQSSSREGDGEETHQTSEKGNERNGASSPVVTVVVVVAVVSVMVVAVVALVV
jgi:cobalamin biosynthesis Mg chelatase CobN